MGDVRRFQQVAGHVAIDFVNTLGGRADEPDDEYLHTYADLVHWTTQVKLLPPDGAGRLLAVANADATEASKVLDKTRHLRGTLDRLLRSRIDQRNPERLDDVVGVQAAYIEAIARAYPDLTSDGLLWKWQDDAGDLERPLWPIAVAAIELLQSGELQVLGHCHHCRWLFLDTSRQHNRRWCSMNGCGAIMKMRRYRAARQP